MLRYLLYVSFTLVTTLSLGMCVQAQPTKIYLNPKAAGSTKQSMVIDSVRFIPLEVRPDVDLGKYNYIAVTANYFVVVDYPERMIYLYSKAGAFVRKITYKKLGENFSPSYREKTNQLVFFGNNTNYLLTTKDRVKIMQEWSQPKNKKYFRKYVLDLGDTTFTIRKEDPTENDVLGAVPLYDDYYWRGSITTSDLYRDSLDYELKIYKDKHLVKGFFPYNRINEPRFLFTEEDASCNSSDSANVFFVTRPYCDTIYRLVNETLAPAYQIVVPLENSLPPSFYTRRFANKTERENFRRNNGWLFHQLYSFYETPRFMFLGVRFLSNWEAYLYDKQAKISYKAKNIRPDSTQYNLALMGDFGFQRDGNRFYQTQKAGDLLDFFESHKSAIVPKELERYLKSKPPRTSPLIVEFKLKN